MPKNSRISEILPRIPEKSRKDLMGFLTASQRNVTDPKIATDYLLTSLALVYSGQATPN